MSKPALRHMMLNDDVLAGEFETILGYRTSHAGLVLSGEFFSALLPANDPTLLENVDFRNGLNSGILTGWTQRGTGHTYDTRGFRASAGGLRLDNAALSAALQSSGSVIIEVERAGLAFNDADKDAADFEDLGYYNPGGGYPTPRTADADTPWLFYSRDLSGFTQEHYIYVNQAATANDVGWVDALGGGAIVVSRITDRVPAQLDPNYATVVLTWSGTTETLIIDGLVISQRTISAPGANRLDRIEICGGGDVASRWWGSYAIRRLQISTASLAPVTSTTKVALLGDSFVQRATDRASVAADTVAEFDGKQSDLAIGATRLARINQAFGNSNWGWWLQSLAYLRNRQRKWFTIYNAGYGGRGWRSDVGTQFGTVGQRAAVIAHNPNVLVCFGSVNDVNLADTTEDIVTDITTYLTPLIAGCTNLTRVFWFHTFFMPETYQTNNTAAQYAEAARQIAKFNTLSLTVNNAAAQPVTVQFIPTWDAWAPGGTGVARYGIGSHPNNAVVGSVRTAVFDGDVHPTSEGMARIAEIVWPYLKDLL